MSENRIYLKEELPKYIGKYIIKNHLTPTVEEVAGPFQISKDTAHKYLLKLDEEGTVPYRHRIGIPAFLFKSRTAKGA